MQHRDNNQSPRIALSNTSRPLDIEYKTHAFHHLIRNLHVGTSRLNLTVIGDSEAEHQAGLNLKK